MRGQFDNAPQGYRSAPALTYPTHRGDSAPDAAYWVPPDPQIGEVLSAWSNQTRSGFRPRPRKQLVALALTFVLLVGVFTFMGGAGLAWLLGDVLELAFDVWMPFVVVGTIFTAIGAVLVKPRPTCSYVGTEGIEEHSKRPLKDTHQVLRFEDAATLTVGETERYTNGAYQGTDFVFTWLDETGAKLFVGRGTRFTQGMWRELEIPAWDFMCAAEARWNAFRWARIEGEFAAHGQATFGDLAVRERELVIDGQALSTDDIDRVEIERGVFRVVRVDAKKGLFKSTGVHTRMVRDIADFPLFLKALRRWAELRI